MQPRSVADFTGPCKDNGEEQCFMHCPVCGSQGWNVYLNTVTGKWFCFARGHGSGGKVLTEDWSGEARAELLELLSYGVPNTHSWPELDMPAWKPLGQIANNYLTRRGVLRSTCGSLGIVEMRVSPRILIPYKGPHGRIIHWTGRAFGSELDDVPKYMSAPGAKPLFMLPHWEAVRAAVVVEGVFDAIAVWQATGLPVVSIGGKVLSRGAEIDLRKLVRKQLWVMLDGDAQVQAMELQDKLMDQYTCKLVMLEDQMDPADMSPELIRRGYYETDSKFLGCGNKRPCNSIRVTRNDCQLCGGSRPVGRRGQRFQTGVSRVVEPRYISRLDRGEVWPHTARQRMAGAGG